MRDVEKVLKSAGSMREEEADLTAQIDDQKVGGYRARCHQTGMSSGKSFIGQVCQRTGVSMGRCVNGQVCHREI